MQSLDPIVQALLATLFTRGVTALGAASVFVVRGYNQKVLDWLLGFAGGVMVAASFSLRSAGLYARLCRHDDAGCCTGIAPCRMCAWYT